MIEVVKILDADRLSRVHELLENLVRPHLSPDHSNYSKGRLRAWLGVEPPLIQTMDYKAGVPAAQEHYDLLKDCLDWDFNFCLCTWSGDVDPVGILPHRDSGFASYEAHSLNITGTCTFNYWNGRNSFGKAADTHWYSTNDAPTHTLQLIPGTHARFNCKNLHQAIPSAKRWNINFWRQK